MSIALSVTNACGLAFNCSVMGNFEFPKHPGSPNSSFRDRRGESR
jgi:hypothetical protein